MSKDLATMFREAFCGEKSENPPPLKSENPPPNKEVPGEKYRRLAQRNKAIWKRTLKTALGIEVPPLVESLAPR